MKPPTGLIIVHGIGNQQIGGLRDALASRLCDAGAPSPRRSASAAHSAGAGCRLETPAAPEVLEISVDGTPVLVCEGNWANVSHPDNPPRVRESSDVVTEFYKTVCTAWDSAIHPFRRDAAAPTSTVPKPMLVWLGIAAVVNLLALLSWRLEWSVDKLSAALDENEWAIQSFGLGVVCMCVYSAVQAFQKWKWNRQDSDRSSRSYTWPPVQLPLVVLWGFYRPFLFMIGAEMVFALSFAVFLAYPVNILGWLLAYPFRGVGRALSGLGLHSPARWVHRVGCVMVVLPTHSYLQAVKATGNLFSILFSERGAVVRLSALLGFIWVGLGFLVLLVVSEILLLIPLAVFLPGLDLPPVGVSTFVLVCLPLYLLLLRILLPAIDLALDVSNYHLASLAEREEYFVRLDGAVAALMQRGCKEIHLLAHSLGSVIAYDWLHARDHKSRPVVTFHTIGSPLDKFWYIDHGQQGRGRDRKSLAGRISGAWVNHWAFSDPVSGSLSRFGAPPFQLINNRVRWLGPYLYSHGRYWTNESVVRSIRASLKSGGT